MMQSDKFMMQSDLKTEFSVFGGKEIYPHFSHFLLRAWGRRTHHKYQQYRNHEEPNVIVLIRYPTAKIKMSNKLKDKLLSKIMNIALYINRALKMAAKLSL